MAVAGVAVRSALPVPGTVVLMVATGVGSGVALMVCAALAGVTVPATGAVLVAVPTGMGGTMPVAASMLAAAVAV